MVRRILGIWKTMAFLLKLPLERLHGSDGWGKRALGRVRLRIGEREVTFQHFDIGHFNEIVVGSAYELEGFVSLQESDCVVVDLGANIGIFSIAAAARFPRCQVISVEPDPTNFLELSNNVQCNKLSNIMLVQAAVDMSTGVSELFRHHSTSHSIVKSGGARELIKVRGMSMNDLMSKQGISKIDFLKVDVEGAEFLIFKETSWMTRVNKIAMEVHSGVGEVGSLIDTIEAQGFEVRVEPHTIIGPMIYARSGSFEKGISPE